MVETRRPIQVAEAVRLVMEHIQTLGTETIAI